MNRPGSIRRRGVSSRVQTTEEAEGAFPLSVMNSRPVFVDAQSCPCFGARAIRDEAAGACRRRSGRNPRTQKSVRSVARPDRSGRSRRTSAWRQRS